ncbi:hypothetical protein ACLOJK_032032 [Asimina triloba]
MLALRQRDGGKLDIMGSQDSTLKYLESTPVLYCIYQPTTAKPDVQLFGSAGVIGNPMGFARNVGLGIRDFLSVPAKGIFQSPSGLLTGMVQGTKSLLSNTVYAVSNAATQFSKAAHKGIVAFTFDEYAFYKVKKQQDGLDSQSKGLLNEFLEGLTGLLQSPIRGAEKHGLPGVLSGTVLCHSSYLQKTVFLISMTNYAQSAFSCSFMDTTTPAGIARGTAGLVARPVVSILEVTGKTAQSIRNRSRPHQSKRLRVRFPRPLAKEAPLSPYCWEEAIGTSMLLEASNAKYNDEIYIMCKALKEPGKFVLITEQIVMIFECSNLVGFGSPEFAGVADLKWVIEAQMGLEAVIHIDREEDVLNIVGSRTEILSRLHQPKSNLRIRQWEPSASSPFVQMGMQLSSPEQAEDVLRTLWSTIKQGRERSWGGITSSQLQTAIRDMKSEGTEPAAVFITSPTYHGICNNVCEIAQLCHAHGIPVIADEAHAAHFRFHHQMPSTALEQGADVAMQFTQMSLIEFKASSYLLELEIHLLQCYVVGNGLKILQFMDDRFME